MPFLLQWEPGLSCVRKLIWPGHAVSWLCPRAYLLSQQQPRQRFQPCATAPGQLCRCSLPVRSVRSFRGRQWRWGAACREVISLAVVRHLQEVPGELQSSQHCWPWCSGWRSQENSLFIGEPPAGLCGDLPRCHSPRVCRAPSIPCALPRNRGQLRSTQCCHGHLPAEAFSHPCQSRVRWQWSLDKVPQPALAGR